MHCHLRPPDAMPLPTQNLFTASQHQRRHWPDSLTTTAELTPAAKKPNAVSFAFDMRRHLDAASIAYEGWILRPGINSGTIFRRLGTKVHEILRQYRKPFPFVVSSAIPRLTTRVLFWIYSPLDSTLCCEVVKNTEKVYFVSNFMWL